MDNLRCQKFISSGVGGTSRNLIMKKFRESCCDKSEFLIGEDGTSYENDVIRKFQDRNEFKDFLHAKSWKVRLRVGKLVVKTSFDLFRLWTLGGYFVSEKLKEAIEQEGFTGMRFEPADFVTSEP